MFDRLREDIAVVFDRDPAARSHWEVLTCYPGLHALVWHRLLPNRLWRAGWHWLARWLAHCGRFFTGIEIHPGATIARFIMALRSAARRGTKASATRRWAPAWSLARVRRCLDRF